LLLIRNINIITNNINVKKNDFFSKRRFAKNRTVLVLLLFTINFKKLLELFYVIFLVRIITLHVFIKYSFCQKY